ncbi:MAG: sodium:solute symporter [Steroidobacteraceae bacterium]
MSTLKWVRGVLIALISTLACGAASASTSGNVSSVRTTELPPVPHEGRLIGLATVGDRSVAIQSDGAWVLKTDRSGWTPTSWGEPTSNPPIRELVSDGHQAFALLGGEHKDEVTRVARLELEGEALRLHALLPLPVPLSSALGATQGSALLLVGIVSDGSSRMFELSSSAGRQSWITHGGWLGGGVPTSLVIQNSAVYLTVHDGLRTADRLLRWSIESGWQAKADAPGPIVMGSGRAIGQAHILFLVHDTDRAARLVSFHTISDAWARLPYRGMGDTLGTVAWGNGILLAREANGRVHFETAELQSGRRGLGTLDWAIVIVYLGAMLSVGFYFYRRAKRGSTADFFVGNRSIPFWAAGVSLYAANVSSISYLATPAKAFETNWQYMTGKLVTVIGLMFVAVWVVPALRRLNLVSAFNYLEMRFNPAIRMFASGACIAMNVGSRMSVVLYLPALAIATITGVDVVWTILIMGVCTIIYTAVGGMRAVVWTDFIQVLVLMGGALFAIGFVIHSLGGAAIYKSAMAYDKTRLLNFSFDLTQPTVWGFILLILCDTVLTFPKDQVLMQRTLATSSEANAGRSVWLFAAVLLPGGLTFYVIGTVLFAYFQAHPERMDPLLPIDATFPSFIATELPSGVTGIIVVGIFAAAMGSLSGTINSVATLLSVDFYEKLARNPTQPKSVRFAEVMSVVVGLVGIGLALLLSLFDIHSLLDLTIELAGLLGGGFAGAYTLGMFTRRANSAGAAIGMATAIVVTAIAWSMKLLHPYFYLAVSIVVCILVGYVASLLFPAPQHSLEGLTLRISRDRGLLRPEEGPQ